MTQVFFHCSNTEGTSTDQCGANVRNLIEAHDHAALVVRSFITAPNTEDWRNWVLHVSDELGEEIFCMPFASMLGKAH